MRGAPPALDGHRRVHSVDGGSLEPNTHLPIARSKPYKVNEGADRIRSFGRLPNETGGSPVLPSPGVQPGLLSPTLSSGGGEGEEGERAIQASRLTQPQEAQVLPLWAGPLPEGAWAENFASHSFTFAIT